MSLVVFATFGFFPTLLTSLPSTLNHVYSEGTLSLKALIFALTLPPKKSFSCLVKIVESVFPFVSLQSHLPRPQPDTIST